MKKWITLLSGLPVCFLVLLNVPATLPAQAPLFLATPPASFFAPAGDSIPKIAPPKLPAPKVNLIKKIGELLKFRKNIQAAEQKRILEVIGKTFLKDSVMANSAEIRRLNMALSDTINQRFDSLVALINALSLKGGRTDTIFPIPQPLNENDTLVSDSEISDLVDKILPLVREKIKQENSRSAGAEKLKALRFFYGRAERASDTVAVNDTFSLILNRRAAVYSVYPSQMEGSYLNYNFGITGTLLYESYELNGKTGRSRSLGAWATDNVLRAAQNAGCRVLLTVSDSRADDIAAFLRNSRAQEVLKDSLLSLLHLRKANGVNIRFEGLNKKYREDFVSFIAFLSGALKADDPANRLTVTLPPWDNGLAYDVNELDPYADQFLINFGDHPPGRTAGPLAPLKGPDNNSIESAASRYLNANVAPSKFILCLPYYGSEWQIAGEGRRDRFRGYLTFNDIAGQFHQTPVYDPVTSSACINVGDQDGNVTSQIWYDDGKTLAQKYDFILQNKLGGLGICPLGSGDGYNDIWTGIADRFLTVDTLYKNDPREAERLREDSLFLSRIKKESLGTTWRHVKSYHMLRQKVFFLFEHPCANVFSSDPRRKFRFPGEPFRENRAEYYRILRITKAFLGGLNLLFLLLLGITACSYIYQLRKKGDRWKFRRLTGGILILLVNLLVLLIFMFLFLSDAFPGFGANSNRFACYDMPLQTLLAIIISGVIIGTVVMRYLIFPIIRRDDTP